MDGLKKFFMGPEGGKEPGGAGNREYLSERSINELVRSTKFDSSQIERLGEFYLNMADHNGNVDKARFQERLGLIAARKPLLAHRLFEQFCKKKDGHMTFHDYVMGLHLLGKADTDERIKFCFKLFDVHNSDHLSKADMRAMMESTLDCAFTIAETAAAGLGAKEPAAKRLEGEAKIHNKGEIVHKYVQVDAKPAELVPGKHLWDAPPEEVLTRMVDNVFEAADTNRDGKITLREFKAWVQKDPGALDLCTFYYRVLVSVDLSALVLTKM